MRLYNLRYFPDDGSLQLLRRKDCTYVRQKLKRKRRCNGERVEEKRPHQRIMFEDVTGTEDRMNVPYMGTISSYVFCTPRCYMTKSWEVGICNTYQLKYLCGGAAPTSFDIHILMVMEGIQVFLQQMEIREQTVGYFYIPDDLCGWIGLPKWCKMIPDSCRGLWRLIDSMQKHMMGDDTGMSITAMLAHLNITRRSYFNDLHMDVRLGTRSPHKIFLKLLGYLYGKLVGRILQKRLILRQYFGRCPFQPQVV